MRMKGDFVLYGAKAVNVNMDGKLYDSTKLYLGLPISNGNGICTAEYVWGDSSNYEKHIKDIQLPCDVVVDFEMFTNGKVQRTEIHDIQFKKSAKQQTA